MVNVEVCYDKSEMMHVFVISSSLVYLREEKSIYRSVIEQPTLLRYDISRWEESYKASIK